MAYIAEAIAEEFCIFGNNVKAKENGKGQNKNVFNGCLTARSFSWNHTLMVA